MKELKEEIEKLENLIAKAKEEDIKDDEIIKRLQAINDLFLTKCNIEIEHKGESVLIIPIETEIYFSNSKTLEKKELKKIILSKDGFFHDGMCHRKELQKNNFGNLYFHRYDKNEKIKCVNASPRGGLDICISQGDYYLSILIRSAFINGTKPINVESGTNKICGKIAELFKSEKTQNFFIELEENKNNKNVIVPIYPKTDIDTNNIYHQPRISGNHYFKENEQKGYKLNSLILGEKEKDKDGYKYLNIIKTRQAFYKEKKNIKQIIENFEKQQTKKQ